MISKGLLCASVAALALAGAPRVAYAAPSDPQTTVQDAPKPAAASDQAVSPTAPAPALQQTPAEGGDIVVTGLRRSIQSAQAIKKNSDGIVDAIVAEDIGKLPDTFASSALQRVSGVTVTRGGGEAAGVTVRGLPDLSTTYNGRELFTAEGRYVQIQDFPAGTVAALEVYKSGTADQIEGGIAGQVNVRGRKPFDFTGFELSGSANEVYFEQAKKFSPNGNLLVSDRWDTGIGEMGLLVNVAYVGIDFLDATREQSLVIQTANAAIAPGSTTAFRYPDAQGRYTGYGHRWRPSANAAFQWKPTPELEIYADGLFQGFRSRDENSYMFVPVFGDGLQISNVAYRTDNPLLARSLTTTGGQRPDGYYGSVQAKTDTYQGGGGAIWQHDRLKLSADIAYTSSTYTAHAVNVDYAFASSPSRRIDYEVSGQDGGPAFHFIDFDLTNPANFISRGFYQENVVASGKDIQTRGDVDYDVGDGLLRRIQVGVRYNDRDAARDRGAPYIANETNRIPIGALPVDVGLSRPGFAFNNAFDQRYFAAIPADSIRKNIAALRSYFGAPAGLPAFSPNETFRANEKALALYGQVKYGFDLGGSMVLDGLVGLRAVRTRTTVNGITQVANADGSFTYTPLKATNQYWDYLPNVSARLGFTDKLQLRAAYTQTRTRPGYFSLNPALVVATPVTPDGDGDINTGPRRGITQGNPDLTPLNSNNYDLSLEWYFSRTGSLTGALFRRDARGFIYNFSQNLDSFPGVDTGGTPSSPVGVTYTQALNSGKTRLQGAEVAFSSFLDIDGLPYWAKGFGVQANGTYVDAKGDLPPDFAATINGEQRPFNGVSKWTYNLIGLYERPFFSARVAYNYRSKFVQYYSLEALDPTVHGIVERGRGQLDFSTSVTPVPNITLAFDIANLLGNPLRRYRQFDTAGDAFPRQVLYIERSYSLGIRFRF